jgi:hypothetical protein
MGASPARAPRALAEDRAAIADRGGRASGDGADAELDAGWRARSTRRIACVLRSRRSVSGARRFAPQIRERLADGEIAEARGSAALALGLCAIPRASKS